MLGQPRDVLAALAQGRVFDREHAEPIEEILAETSGFDLGCQVAVGRGQHAHVDLAGLGFADPLDFLLLQDAQQFRLHRQGQLADFIEEKRAAAREFEAPGLVALRSGERAARMAEELALEQGLGNRRCSSP